MTVRYAGLDLDGPVVLAPMAGYTDAVYRRLCREQGSALGITELVSAEGLLRTVRSTVRLIEIDEGERPAGVQLYGHDPARIAEAAARVEELVAPDLIDLNMGCPARKVIRKGGGVALMRDPAAAAAVMRGVRAAVSCPVTVKIRAGWSADEVNAVEVARAVRDEGCDGVVVHGRTRPQLHAGPVDLDLIAAVRGALDIPVIGNGGVATAGDARDMMDRTGVEAVMVGHAAIGDPWVLRRVAGGLAGREPLPPSPGEMLDVITRHLDGLIDANRRYGVSDGERRACTHLRGHLVRYLAGRRGSGAFRRRLMTLTSRQLTLDAVRDVLFDPTE